MNNESDDIDFSELNQQIRAAVEAGARGDWKSEGYKIRERNSFSHTEMGSDWIIEAIDPKGKLAGYLRVYDLGPNTMTSSDTWIEPEHRRKGLASALYQYAEKKTGKRMIPAEEASEDPDNFSADAEKLWNQQKRQFGETEAGIEETAWPPMTKWPVNQIQDLGPSWGAETTDRATANQMSSMQHLNEAFAKSMRKKSVQKLILGDTQNWDDVPDNLSIEKKENFILERAFMEDYPEWMRELEREGEVGTDYIILHRGISADSKDGIKKNQLGIYWTWNKTKAANYSGKNTNKKLFTLKAKVPFSSINFDNTLRKLVWRGYSRQENEHEFELRPGAPLEIVSIDEQPATFKAKATVQASIPKLLDDEAMEFEDWLDQHDPVTENVFQTKDQAKEWFTRRSHEIKKQFSDLKDNIILYRMVGFHDPEERQAFIESVQGRKYVKGFKGLGIYWSHLKRGADAYEGGPLGVLIIARVPQKSIDWDGTYSRLMDPMFSEDEEEIRLKPGGFLEVLKLLDRNGKVLWEPKSSHRMRAGFYFWDDQDGPLYPDSPMKRPEVNQQTWNNQSMNWPSVKLSGDAQDFDPAFNQKIRDAEQLSLSELTWEDFKNYWGLADIAEMVEYRQRIPKNYKEQETKYESIFDLVKKELLALHFPLKVYRGIPNGNDHPHQFGPDKHFGLHWSVDPKAAKSFGANVWETEVTADEIAWLHTIYTRLDESFRRNEKEITLRDGIEIEIRNIDTDESKQAVATQEAESSLHPEDVGAMLCNREAGPVQACIDSSEEIYLTRAELEEVFVRHDKTYSKSTDYETLMRANPIPLFRVGSSLYAPDGQHRINYVLKHAQPGLRARVIYLSEQAIQYLGEGETFEPFQDYWHPAGSNPIQIVKPYYEILASPTIETLKKNKKPLTAEERDQVMKAGAVWHHGPNGEETPAVQKATVKGKDWYWCATHRAGQIRPTLKGAIRAYDFIKTTASVNNFDSTHQEGYGGTSWPKKNTTTNIGRNTTVKSSMDSLLFPRRKRSSSTITTGLSPILENFVVLNLPAMKKEVHHFFQKNQLPPDLQDNLYKALNTGNIRYLEQIEVKPKNTGPSGEIQYAVRFKFQFGYLKDNIRIEFTATEYPDISDTLLVDFVRIDFREGFYKKIESRKSVGILYHFTTPKGMKEILDDNFHLRTVNREQISLTRDPNLDFHASESGWNEEREDWTGNHEDIKTTYRIAIDGDKLSDKYKIQPYADGVPFSRDHKPESEETIRKTEVDISNCVLSVDHLMDFSYEKEYGEDFKYQDEIAEGLRMPKIHEVHTFYPLTEVASAVGTEAALEFKTAPMLWNGRSKIDKGVSVGPRTYNAPNGIVDFLTRFVQIADEDLLNQIKAAKTPKDVPEIFWQQNDDMIYFEDMTFYTYRLTDNLHDTILRVLLSRKPLPLEFRVVLFTPERDKKYLVKDLLQRGEQLLQS